MTQTTRLLDQYGNPLKRKVLTKRVAEPGIGAIRNIWQPSVATGLTPESLARILAAANDGDLHAYLTLAEEMEERDHHYASVLGIRKRAISGVEPIVNEVSDNGLDKRIADDVRENIAEHDGFSDLVEDMLDALGKGFSQVEILWKRNKSNWRIDSFDHIDPRFFVFDRENGKEIRLLDEEEPVNGIPLAPFKWISHRAKLKSGLVFRGGLARLAAFGFLCKAYTIKDWMAFVETYGLPLRIGRYGPEATKEDVEQLFLAVANIGTDAAAVLPKSMQIDFEQVMAGPGNDIFEKFARWTDEQVSKAVLGQTMTSDNGSSQAQANVHNEVRHDIAKSDARSVTGTINRDVVKPYVDLHYGPQENYPEISIQIEEAEDLDLTMRHTFSAVDRGVKVRASEVREKLGYSEPDKDDDVLMPVKQAGPAASAPPEGQARNRPVDHADPYQPIDAIEAGMNAEWEAVLSDMVGPVMEILEAAESYEEARALLDNAFPQMGASVLIDSLVKGSVQARAEGDAGDG